MIFHSFAIALIPFLNSFLYSFRRAAGRRFNVLQEDESPSLQHRDANIGKSRRGVGSVSSSPRGGTTAVMYAHQALLSKAYS